MAESSLNSLYLIVWMDGIVFKVRDNGKVINKTVYLCVGLNKDGFKEVLGMWVGKTDSAKYDNIKKAAIRRLKLFINSMILLLLQ